MQEPVGGRHGTEREFFQKFSKVAFMDFTANSNNEKRPLYFMCFKLSNGSSCVALRAILPSEQSWVCEFLNSTAMPLLLGRKAMARVVMGITDQCSNESTAWASARARGVHSAYHCLCAWHKIYQGIRSIRLGTLNHPYVLHVCLVPQLFRNLYTI